MNTYFDCIPCFLRQAIDLARFVTDDQAIHEKVIREVLREVSTMDLSDTPPAMGQRIHTLVRQLTNNRDPYRQIKDTYNRFALGLYDEMKQKINAADNPFDAAVRLAIAGNIIDFGPQSHLTHQQVTHAIDECFTAALPRAAVTRLNQAIRDAQSILYLADNAGEIVFDRLLIEQLPHNRVTVAVKAGPIINDATIEDAQAVGLTQLVEVIDNGSDAPGTILADCSQAFRQRFHQADLIIAKGQGNYETLSNVNATIFFLLKAKCPVIAGHLDMPLGSLVLTNRTKTQPQLLGLVPA